MTTTIVVNGQNFEYPVTGDTSWGGPATEWAQAVSLHLLQKTGGQFTLTADVNFGATFGLTSVYYKSATTPRSGVGVLRLANTDDIAWRNNADGADLLLGVGTDDLIEFGGVDLALVTQLVTTFLGLSDTPSSYSGQALLGLRINAGETAIEFAAITAVKTFQEVYDDSASDAIFDLDTNGSFTVRSSAGNPILSVNEVASVTDEVLFSDGAGVQYLTIKKFATSTLGPYLIGNKPLVFETSDSSNNQIILNTGGGGQQIYSGSATLLVYGAHDASGANLVGATRYTSSGTPTDATVGGRIESGMFTANAFTVGTCDHWMGDSNNGVRNLVIGASGASLIYFGDGAITSLKKRLGSRVDDTSAPKKLFVITPDTASTFSDPDSYFFRCHDLSSFKMGIKHSGAIDGPVGDLETSTEKHAADSAAGDASAEHIFFSAQNPITITRVVFLPDAALTANDTNFATLIIARRDNAGINQATIVSVITNVAGTGNWTAFDAVDFGTLSATAVAANEVLTFEITKGASGVVVPSGTIQVEYTLD